jgi:hypothetical protein
MAVRRRVCSAHARLSVRSARRRHLGVPFPGARVAQVRQAQRVRGDSPARLQHSAVSAPRARRVRLRVQIPALTRLSPASAVPDPRGAGRGAVGRSGPESGDQSRSGRPGRSGADSGDPGAVSLNCHPRAPTARASPHSARRASCPERGPRSPGRTGGPLAHRRVAAVRSATSAQRCPGG